jgi:hypothetical protein
MRVLLITPRFYGLEEIIKSVLEESGFEVVWFENKTLPLDYHGTYSKFKFLRKLYYFVFLPDIRYLKQELNKIDNLKFDILFSINAHIICPFLFRKLKSINPELHSVLYLWDSFSKYNWIKELKLFNKAITFDPKDSIKYNIEYKPNFYLKSANTVNLENEHDLIFIGKFNPERLTLIEKISSLPDISIIKFDIRLWPAAKVFFHNRILYKFLQVSGFKSPWINNYLLNYEAVEGIANREFIIPESLEYTVMQYHLLNSNVVLDIPYHRQSGYTHRVIEALANGRKIITTNSNICDECFYNSDQIHVIDEKKPEIDVSWIKELTSFPVHKYFSSLELSEWLKSIINVAIA